MSTESTQTNNPQVNIQSSIEYTRSLQQHYYCFVLMWSLNCLYKIVTCSKMFVTNKKI